jgi:hypothetical protein
MNVERAEPRTSVADVLDRVLDRGIVIDAWVRVAVAGIALIDVDARIVVASIDTYVEQAAAIGPARLAARPPTAGGGASPGRTPIDRPRPARVRLRCGAGCTFLRRAARRPATVRCPGDGGRCAVAPLADDD